MTPKSARILYNVVVIGSTLVFLITFFIMVVRKVF